MRRAAGGRGKTAGLDHRLRREATELAGGDECNHLGVSGRGREFRRACGQFIALALGRVIPAAPAGKRVHHEASGGTRTLTTLGARKLEFQSRFFGCMMTVAE